MAADKQQIEDMADHVMRLVMIVRDPNVLTEVATGLDIVLAEGEGQPTVRELRRLLMESLTHPDIEHREDIFDNLTGLYEIMNTHIHPDPQDERDAGAARDNRALGGQRTPVRRGGGFEPDEEEEVKDPTPFGTPLLPPNLKKNNQNLPNLRTNVVPMRVHRFKEFKIHGEIGEPVVDGQKSTKKNELTYSNVMFQIKNGIVDRYSEMEICSAVIRAVTATDLRGYLEERVMEEDLDLKGLENVLKTHFKVKDATAVFQELVTMVQKGGENEMNFATKMMDLRKKVIRLSKEEGGNYSQNLVQQQFQKSLYSGLRPGSIRQGLRLLLKSTEMVKGAKQLKTVSDDVLREEISELMLNETEHAHKTGTPKKEKAGVSKLQFEGLTEEQELDEVTQSNTVANGKRKVNLAQIAKQMDDRFVQFTKDMESLKTTVHNNLNVIPPQQPTVENEDDYIGSNDGAHQEQPPARRGGGGASRGYRGYRGQGGRGSGRGYGYDGHGSDYRGNGGRGGGRGGRGRGRGWRGYRDEYVPRLCEKCTAEGAVGCNHCFNCGKVTHKEWNCPEKNEPRV